MNKTRRPSEPRGEGRGRQTHAKRNLTSASSEDLGEEKLTSRTKRRGTGRGRRGGDSGFWVKASMGREGKAIL